MERMVKDWIVYEGPELPLFFQDYTDKNRKPPDLKQFEGKIEAIVYGPKSINEAINALFPENHDVTGHKYNQYIIICKT